MQLHDIKPTIKSKKDKRVGRGGKRGTFSGKGVKGQKARAGRKLEPPIRGLIKKYHKLKGYKTSSIKKENIVAVNLSTVNDKFKKDEVVSPALLTERKIIRRSSGKLPIVKILGNGTISKPLVFENCVFSESAKEKIEKTGGKTENNKEKIKNKIAK